VTIRTIVFECADRVVDWKRLIGLTTLKFYAQFTGPADQCAAAVILHGLRKEERLRELYYHYRPASGRGGLAAVIGPQAGLQQDTALAWLTEFAAAD
jgi:hypothetical protein